MLSAPTVEAIKAFPLNWACLTSAEHVRKAKQLKLREEGLFTRGQKPESLFNRKAPNDAHNRLFAREIIKD